MSNPHTGTREPARAIDEALFLSVNGEDQWVTLRGADADNPVMLVLTGPGAAFSGAAAMFQAWERDLTVAQWDQPHAGATYDRHGAPADYGFDRLARDAAAVAEGLTARLGIKSLIVLGISGGSIIGLKLVKARPDLVAAYVGTGQVANWARQEALAYDGALARARASNDTDAVAALTRIGPPPWSDITGDAVAGQYANAMTAAETAAFQAALPRLAAPKHDARAVSTAAFARLKPAFAAFDAHDLGPDFQVPMLFLQGTQDLRTAASEVEAYAATLRAPHVVFERLEDGGHSAFLTEAFRQRLLAHLRAKN